MSIRVGTLAVRRATCATALGRNGAVPLLHPFGRDSAVPQQQQQQRNDDDDAGVDGDV
jgi:hypothetical protein